MSQESINQAVSQMVAAITRAVAEAMGGQDVQSTPTPAPQQPTTVGDEIKASLITKINRYTSGADTYGSAAAAADEIVETVLASLSPMDRRAAESLLSRTQR